MTTDTQSADINRAEWADVSSGTFFGSALIVGAILTMRPMLSGFGEPSVANALLMSLVTLLAATVLGRAIFDHTLPMPGKWVSLPLAAVLLTGIASLALTSHQWPARLGALSWITNVILFFSVYALCATPEDRGRAARRAVVSAVLATGGVIALYGIYQRFAVMPGLLDNLRDDARGRALLLLPGAVGRVASGEVSATFVTPNALAGYLAVLLPLAAGLFFWAAGKRRRPVMVVSLCLAVVLALALVFTGSPGGFVAAASGALVMYAVLRGSRIRETIAKVLPEERPKRTAAIVAGVVLCVVCAVVLSWAAMRTSSMQTRAEYWKATAAMVADNPLGVGLGNFADRYPQYKTPAGWETREAHNAYLGLLAEAGPLCLLAFGLLIYGVARTLARTGPLSPLPDEEESPGPARLGVLALAGGLSGMVAAYAIGARAGNGMHSNAIVELLMGQAGGATIVTALTHIAFVFVWAVLFLVFFDADVDNRNVRAGIVAGLCALAVHGLVEFDFKIKTTMLVATTLGAVALSVGKAFRPDLKGIRTAIPAVTAAVVLIPLFLFGSSKLMRLWELSALADDGMTRAEQLEDIARDVPQAALDGDYDRVESLIAPLEDPSLRIRIADLRDAASLSHVPRLRRAASDFASEARREAKSSLVRSWELTGEYLGMAPGDGERVSLFVRLAEMLRARGVGKETRTPVERAIRLLTARAPYSSSAWSLLGRHQAEAGHLTQAAASFQKAAETYPLDPEAWLRAGDASVFFDPERAETLYAKAIAANRIVSDENTSLFARLWTVRPGRPSRADQLVKLEARGSSAPFVFRAALMHWEIGGYTDAAKRLDKALELEPGDPQLAAFKALLLRLERFRIEHDVFATSFEIARRFGKSFETHPDDPAFAAFEAHVSGEAAETRKRLDKSFALYSGRPQRALLEKYARYMPGVDTTAGTDDATWDEVTTLREAIETRTDAAALAALKAALLRLEKLRDTSRDAAEAADAAWGQFLKMQEEAPHEKRLSGDIVDLFRQRGSAMARAASGVPW